MATVAGQLIREIVEKNNCFSVKEILTLSSTLVGDNYYRPDLKNAALARLSAVHQSPKVAKSGVKKRNRQVVKICHWS